MAHTTSSDEVIGGIIILLLGAIIVGVCVFMGRATGRNDAEKRFFGENPGKVTAAIRVEGKIYPISSPDSICGKNEKQTITYKDKILVIVQADGKITQTNFFNTTDQKSKPTTTKPSQ